MFVNECFLILVTASHIFFLQEDDLDWWFEIPATAVRYLAFNAH